MCTCVFVWLVSAGNFMLIEILRHRQPHADRDPYSGICIMEFCTSPCGQEYFILWWKKCLLFNSMCRKTWKECPLTFHSHPLELASGNAEKKYEQSNRNINVRLQTKTTKQITIESNCVHFGNMLSLLYNIHIHTYSIHRSAACVCLLVFNLLLLYIYSSPLAYKFALCLAGSLAVYRASVYINADSNSRQYQWMQWQWQQCVCSFTPTQAKRTGVEQILTSALALDIYMFPCPRLFTLYRCSLAQAPDASLRENPYFLQSFLMQP